MEISSTSSRSCWSPRDAICFSSTSSAEAGSAGLVAGRDARPRAWSARWRKWRANGRRWSRRTRCDAARGGLQRPGGWNRPLTPLSRWHLHSQLPHRILLESRTARRAHCDQGGFACRKRQDREGTAGYS
jgi:hypothetical protein